MLFSFPVLLRVLGSVGDNLIGLTPLRFSLWVGSSNAQGGISPELLEPKWDLGPFRNCWVAESMEARLGRGRGVLGPEEMGEVVQKELLFSNLPMVLSPQLVPGRGLT